GEALPQTAQMAIDEGRQAAKIILSKIQNKPPPLYQPLPNRYILPLGGKFALADLGRIKIKGFLAWMLKELVFLDYLLTILSPLKALTHWLKAVRLFIKND
ncbi:MAG: hypothetical protein HYV54_02215, partial [Parcubacteria group bacterium]|nr:hypothetical protein [Parcubacteria group bacterium]